MPGPGDKQKKQGQGGGGSEQQHGESRSTGSQHDSGALAVMRIAGQPEIEQSSDFGYQRVGGRPFIQGAGDAHAVSPNDVLQGQVGDCWFLAAVIATAAVNPQLIQDLIKPLGGGRYEVTIYTRDDDTTKKTKHLVTIDDTFPVYRETKQGYSFQFSDQLTFEKGSPVFAHGGDGTARAREIWPLLLEKAAAMVWVPGKPGYSQLGGGNGAWGLDMLVPDERLPQALALKEKPREGASMSEWRHPRFMPTPALAERMTLALASGEPIVCGSADTDGRESTYCDGQKIMGGHVYAVVKVDVFNKTLDLQDPNGRTNCTLSIDEWKKCFGYCSIGRSTYGERQSAGTG